MSGISAVRQANKNGVAPVVRNWTVTLIRACFVARTLTFAPCATSFRTNSRLSIFPDPCGAGWLSPESGRGRQGMWGSALDAGCAELGCCSFVRGKLVGCYVTGATGDVH